MKIDGPGRLVPKQGIQRLLATPPKEAPVCRPVSDSTKPSLSSHFEENMHFCTQTTTASQLDEFTLSVAGFVLTLLVLSTGAAQMFYLFFWSLVSQKSVALHQIGFK
ncbi:unnamed protein product [Protopolystoma xenopodis]|uniref:Uncharacterized protein n=1 Tax=Protopolystoma xenopodis TaxID=117903 RepID=A0A448WI13_9PLAT|nr:unnamed protein product [Protopolystoma xenopodis]